MDNSVGNYILNFYPEAEKEFKKLDGTQKVFVLKALKRIRAEGMLVGQQLSGNLHKCKKIKNKKMGLRIIFTQENNQINIIEIIAIGYRKDKQVYSNAKSRILSREDLHLTNESKHKRH